jgi:hypothetical protein
MEENTLLSNAINVRCVPAKGKSRLSYPLDLEIVSGRDFEPFGELRIDCADE